MQALVDQPTNLLLPSVTIYITFLTQISTLTGRSPQGMYAQHSKSPNSQVNATLRMPWSWQHIVSTTAPECPVLSVLSLGVALQTGQSGASEVAEMCISLASIWLAFAGHVVLFWLWLPRRGRWTAPVDSEIQRKTCEMLGISSLQGYQVEALDAGCLNKCDMLVCVPTGSRNSACFEVGLIHTVMDNVTAVSEQLSVVSVIGQICIGLKSTPWWCCGTNRLALTQWRCGSNSTTAFGV